MTSTLCAILGYEEDELLGRRFHEVIHPADRAGELQAFERLLAGQEERYGAEARFVRKSGSVFWARTEATVVRDETGKSICIVSVIEPTTHGGITEEGPDAARRAAERAAERIGRLQAVTAALAGVVTIEQAADIVMEQVVAMTGAQAAAVALLEDEGGEFEVLRSVGFSPDVPGVGQPTAAPGPLPAADVVRTHEPVFLESLDAWRTYYPHLAEIVSAGSAALAALPLTIDERVAGVLLFEFTAPRVFDADERGFLTAIAQQYAQALHRARLYEAERRARAEAEAASRARGEFLAMMSHELRTPLNAISGYTELMQMGIPEPAPASLQPYLQRILQNGRHLLSLIDSVLNFARLSTSQLRYVITDAVVDEVLAMIEPLVEPQVRAKRLVYTCVCGNRSLVMRADVDRVAQILLNLVGNAIKFTEPGGRITLTADEGNGGVTIRVSDTGCGISSDKLDDIFDPFVQLDNRLTRRYEGVGLGLSISRELAKGMGGDLTVTSQVGVGSVFALTLPRPA